MSDHHGFVKEDPYEWIRGDSDSLETALEAERAYSDEMLSVIRTAADSLLSGVSSEMLSAELGFPQRQNGNWFMPHQPPGARYPQILKIPVIEGSDRPPTPSDVLDDSLNTEILIDFDLELGAEHVSVGSVHMSPCERFVAWTEDRTGKERYILRLRHVSDTGGATIEIPNVSATAVFSQSGEYIYVLHLDALNRPHEAWRYKTAGPSAGERVLSEDDAAFRLRIERSLSNAFIFITATNRDTTKNFYVSSTAAELRVQRFPESDSPSKTTTAHVQIGESDYFALTVTSDTLPNGQLFLAQVTDGTLGARSEWRVLLEHSDDVDLSPAVALDSFLMIGAKHAARNSILVAKTDSLDSAAHFERLIPWADANVRLVMSPEWTSQSIVITKASYIEAPAAFQVDLRRLHDAPSVLVEPRSPHRGDQYVEDLIWATAADSTLVPITIVYNRQAMRPGAKTLLTGYGAYNVSMEPRYNPLLLQLLDQGVLFAVAHVRGGGENGNLWHSAARRQTKHLSFSDFIACRDHLVETGWSDGERVIAFGGSAGGLLIGGCLAIAPHKFAGAVLDVPFVDPLTTMLDPDLPLTISDRSEWGDPLADSAAYECIASYSPYENIRPVRYPPVLAICGVNDQRVSAVEPLKWINRLRKEALGGPFVLDVKAGGHVGSGSAQENLRTLATSYAWIANALARDQVDSGVQVD